MLCQPTALNLKTTLLVKCLLIAKALHKLPRDGLDVDQPCMLGCVCSVRSRTPGEKVFCFFVTLFTQEIMPPQNPVQFSFGGAPQPTGWTCLSIGKLKPGASQDVTAWQHPKLTKLYGDYIHRRKLKLPPKTSNSFPFFIHKCFSLYDAFNPN